MLESFIFFGIKLILVFFYRIIGPVSASGSHRGPHVASSFLWKRARLFWSFLVASTTFSLLLIVNSKISLQRLQSGIWEMSTAFSRAAWYTLMDIWRYRKMECTMFTHNCSFAAAGECRFSRITRNLSPCFTIPTCRMDPNMQGERFV